MNLKIWSAVLALGVSALSVQVSFADKHPGKSVVKSVDAATSQLTWKATKKVGAGHYGPLKLKSHTAKFNDKGEFVSGEFVADLTSFDVTDLQGEWRDKFLTHVKSADFFEVEKFPTATLVVSEVKGETAKGKLTIKGKTQDVSFPIKKSSTGYQGALVFDRTQFGVIYGSGNFFKELAADKIINNDVSIEFALAVK